ncbi:MAG: PaaI family thioesterase [Bdellovibrionales bacterium]|nr:PaaI family thioesterase [Bdellovibrionales bacterium]
MIHLIRVGLGYEVFKRVFGIRPKFPKPPMLGNEITMPGQNSELHNGFVNCANNNVGLRATFHRIDSDGVGCRWINQQSGLEGYPGMIHGGISAALLDELMTNTVFHSIGKFGVTYKGTFSWHKPLPAGSEVTGKGEVVYKSKDFIRVRAYLFRKDGKVFASSDAVFYIPTLREFQKMAELASVPQDLHRYFKS